MPGKLEGRVALVTGGGTGIGLATAQRFVREGAYVFIAGRRKPELDAAVSTLGTQATAVRADVSDLSDLDKLCSQIQREKGRLDVLFANAGGGSFVPLGAITEEHYDQTFNTNVKGTLFLVQKVLPLMPNGSSIILNTSIAGSTGTPAFSVYSATKAALRSFARTWTADLKDRKIRVNALSPGTIETPGLSGLFPDENQRKEVYAALASQVPLGRIGDADEVAKAAVFLASDDASFITGIELFVDGGFKQV